MSIGRGAILPVVDADVTGLDRTVEAISVAHVLEFSDETFVARGATRKDDSGLLGRFASLHVLAVLVSRPPDSCCFSDSGSCQSQWCFHSFIKTLCDACFVHSHVVHGALIYELAFEILVVVLFRSPDLFGRVDGVEQFLFVRRCWHEPMHPLDEGQTLLSQ